MLDIRSLRYQQPLVVSHRTNAAAATGYADTLGQPNVCVVVEKGRYARNQKVVIRIVHNTIANYSGGTALSVISTAANSTPDAIPYHINMAGKGRYLGFYSSALTTSTVHGVKCLGFDLETTPPAVSSVSTTAVRYDNFTATTTFKPAL